MTARSHPPRVAVIGGGLAGLAAAWHLDAAGFACRVFESGKRPGGPALSKREGACLFEYTPSVLQLDAALLAWLEQLGLAAAGGYPGVHLVPGGAQGGMQGLADESGGAGQKDVHGGVGWAWDAGTLHPWRGVWFGGGWIQGLVTRILPWRPGLGA